MVNDKNSMKFVVVLILLNFAFMFSFGSIDNTDPNYTAKVSQNVVK